MVHPAYDDVTRTRFVAGGSIWLHRGWLGMGAVRWQTSTGGDGLSMPHRPSVVVTAIVNIWTNDAASIAAPTTESLPSRRTVFLWVLGSVTRSRLPAYRSPVDTMAAYLDELEAAGVRRTVVFSQPWSRALTAWRPSSRRAHTQSCRARTHSLRGNPGSRALVGARAQAVVSTDSELARAIGRSFIERPYLQLRNYVDNLLRHGIPNRMPCKRPAH